MRDHTIILAIAAAGISLSLAQEASAAVRHHHRHHVVVRESHHSRFGSYDPDNIGPYGGRDFGFFGGPNGETTYDYRGLW